MRRIKTESPAPVSGWLLPRRFRTKKRQKIAAEGYEEKKGKKQQQERCRVPPSSAPSFFLRCDHNALTKEQFGHTRPRLLLESHS